MEVIGLDFGTGNSVLALWQGSRSQVFQLDSQMERVPSDVLVSDSNQIDPDPTRLLNPPPGFHRESALKRRLLTLRPDQQTERAALLELAVARLKFLYDTFTTTNPQPVVKAVLTCPANTGQAYRELLLEIGQRVGLPAVDIVDEPTAAAVHHGLAEIPTTDERWLVVDWGCGTCDVSLIERRAGQRDLLVQVVKGANDLGGLDMDERLRQHLAQKYGFSANDCPLWPVEALKIQLSQQEQAQANLAIAGQMVAVSVTRAELEALIQPLLDQAAGLITAALDEAGWGDVDEVIATGGPVLMPAVRRMIAAATEREETDLRWTDPLTSVAQGAARLAELKRQGGLLVTNKVTQSIGLRVVRGNNDDAYQPIIKRGEDRPVTRSVTLTTSTDLQDIIALELREGDNISAQANTLLGGINVVVRPEKKGVVSLTLNVRLTDSSGLELWVEPRGDPNTIRGTEVVGLRLEQQAGQVIQKESRWGDPVEEFQVQVIAAGVDPDTARQIYERLKIKYHPDRQPDRRGYWNDRLAVLDRLFGGYLADIEARVRASTLPDLPWDQPVALQKVVVDEVLARRLAHCLANGIGGPTRQPQLISLLKRFPDYRRVLASYLFGIKRNTVLQTLLAQDDRPHVGLVVLLQNLPNKAIRERHEILKAAYRLPENRVRELLNNPNLDFETLYTAVSRDAPSAVIPMGGGARRTNEQNVPLPTEHSADKSSYRMTYDRDWTWVYGDTTSIEHKLKKVGFVYSGKRQGWFAKRRVDPSELS